MSGTTIRTPSRSHSASRCGTYSAEVTRGTSTPASAAWKAAAFLRRSATNTLPGTPRDFSAAWNSRTSATRRPPLVSSTEKAAAVTRPPARR